MRVSTLVSRAVLVSVVAAASGLLAGVAQAARGHSQVASECATVKVTARPTLNTAMIPETLKSTVTNCSTASETVILAQRLSGPMAGPSVLAKKWTITLAASQAVTKVRHFPYACCGTYTVTDTVTTTSGTQLAKSTASFTFA